MTPPDSAPQRLHFLDNLRGFVVLLVIVLHGTMVYMAYAPEWWYVLDKQNSLFFTMLVLLIDVPIMPALFFLSGYFAMPSIKKRGAAVFLKDKLFRIGLPWVFGVLFLAPLVTYFIYITRDVQVGYLQFWRRDFWGPMYQQSVYWFLGVLFLFFVLQALAYTISPRIRSVTQQVARPGWKLWVGFTALMTAAYIFIGLYFPLDSWNRALVFMIQPLRAPLYIGYFLLGIVAWKQGWFTDEGYKPEIAPWILVAMFSGLFYLSQRMAGPLPAGFSLRLVATGILFNLFCLSAIIACALVFQRSVNRSDGAWGSLAANSYGMYYAHELILFPLAYVFVGIQLPLMIKAPLVLFLAILLTWAFSAWVLKKIPVVNKIF